MNYNIQDILEVMPGFLLGISIHEFSHGLAADRLGDSTPRLQGRLTINPIKHIDPLGFLCLIVFGFGWAKPVMINPRNFKNPKRDDAIVSLAGPLSNFLVALLFMSLIRLTIYTSLNRTAIDIFNGTIVINLMLMVFNLIPIPPLDGHHILGSIGGAKVWNFYYKYREHLRFALLLLIILRVAGRIIFPVISVLYGFLWSIFF